MKRGVGPDLCVLLDRLGPAVPSDMTVCVLCNWGPAEAPLYMRYDRHMTIQATTVPHRQA